MSSFTAYIFKTDCDSLITNARRGASAGSLFGQWTSTGNPVVHVIMKKEEAEIEGQRLYEAYRLCNIGEWRTVDRNERDGRHRIAQAIYEKQRRRNGLGKFLILDVSMSGIKPYLYTPVFIQAPTQPRCQLKDEVGDVEQLNGENPFSRRGHRNPSQFSTMDYRSTAHQQHPVAMWSQEPGRYSPSAHPQDIDIRSHQWYSNEKEGNANLKFVIKELTQIAAGDKLDISRDTITHDLTVMFTDNRYRRSWTVKFPSGFPEDGASVSYKTFSPYGTENSSLLNPKEPGCPDVRDAMRRIVRYITETAQKRWATLTKKEEDWLFN